MEFAEREMLIKTRRSIRKWQDKNVPAAGFNRSQRRLPVCSSHFTSWGLAPSG
jgi:hypothetical protein